MSGTWTYPTRPFVISWTLARLADTHSRYRAARSSRRVDTTTVRLARPSAPATVSSTARPAWLTSSDAGVVVALTGRPLTARSRSPAEIRTPGARSGEPDSGSHGSPSTIWVNRHVAVPSS